MVICIIFTCKQSHTHGQPPRDAQINQDIYDLCVLIRADRVAPYSIPKRNENEQQIEFHLPFRIG